MCRMKSNNYSKNPGKSIPCHRNNQCRSPESAKGREQFQGRKKTASLAELLYMKGKVEQMMLDQQAGFR